MSSGALPLVEVTRRDERSGRMLVESRHRGHLVVTIDDEVVLAFGDAQRPTYLRSSIKPIQAAVCLDFLGQDAADLGPEELAVAWASHQAQDVHLDAVRSLCRRADLAPEHLTCPADRRPHGPADDRRPVFHNCSGKHAMFALAGRRLGLAGPDLLAQAGVLQSAILGRLDHELAGIDAVAVDGCGAPAVRARLVSLAEFFGRFAEGADWRRLREAGFAAPTLVGGTSQLETGLLEQGTAAKVGAEGIYAAGWVADGKRVGVAVKAEDGALRAAAGVLAAVATAGGRSLGSWPGLRSFGGGQVVGEVRVVDELEQALLGLFA